MVVMLSCFLIAANSLYSVITFRDTRIAEQRIEQIRKMLVALFALRESAYDSYIAQRDFLVAGEAHSEQLYRLQTAETTAHLSRLRRLVAGNPAAAARLDTVERLIAEQQGRLDRSVAQRRQIGSPGVAGLDLVADRTGMIRLGAAIQQMQAAQRAMLWQMEAVADREASLAQGALVVGTIGSLVLIGLVFRLMATEAGVRERHVRDRTLELAETNAALRAHEAQLRSREGQLRLLVESTPAAIAMFDRDMRYLAVSRRYRDDYRLGDQPLAGRSHYEVFPELPQAWRDAHQRCLNGAVERADEEAFHRQDGSTDWIRWEVRPWHDSGGCIGGIALFTEVLTAHKQAEQALAESEARLRQAQKMEVVGQLTGGIAHDFNNLLTVVISNVELLRDSVANQPDQAAMATEILEAAESGAELTRRLLAFASKQALQPRIVDLRSYVPSLASMLRRTLGESIRITMRIAGDLWLTQVDQTQVGEALFNLAINARDAMPKGGQLAIAVDNVLLDEEYAAHNTGVVPGEYVLLSATDTGVGMPPEILERAVEPFFTTKGLGHGTGLGLSMIYGFARQSGGHLKIYSEVGCGTTVRLYLPRTCDGETAPAAAAQAEAALPSGSESILLVDDNAQICDVARRHLTAQGYSVSTAGSGPEALFVLQSGEAFDLLFTDVVMPDGMTGYDLAEAALRRRPGLKVLVTTGYGGVPAERGGEYPMLRKPYHRRELAEKVRAVLDGAA